MSHDSIQRAGRQLDLYQAPVNTCAQRALGSALTNGWLVGQAAVIALSNSPALQLRRRFADQRPEPFVQGAAVCAVVPEEPDRDTRDADGAFVLPNRDAPPQQVHDPLGHRRDQVGTGDDVRHGRVIV
jgi:hypothetical protein